MFGLNRLFGNAKTQAQTSSKPRAKVLDLELLEGRTMPATTNYLMIDFTPDSHAGSFSDTFFNTKRSDGYAPSFLDFNKDGRITSTDVTTAASQVANRVAGFFSQFVNNTSNNLNIRYSDVTSNTNWGTQWINYGRSYSSIEVAVMYVGGTNRDGSHILGRAPTAGNEQNVEGFGETYSRTIATHLMNSNRNATSADFVNKVAGTIAHEFGHMMGLQHSTSGDSNNIMAATQSATPNNTYFVSGFVNTVTGYQQNAYKELDASFQLNQSQIGGSINTGQFLHTDEHGCEMDHEGHEDHEGDAADAAYGFDSLSSDDVGGLDHIEVNADMDTLSGYLTVDAANLATGATEDSSFQLLLTPSQSQDEEEFALDRWSVALDR